MFLTQRRVYILPTRHGVLFGAALLLMLIGSINYNLSLGYMLTFLLAGMGVVSILHTFRNLAHLNVSAGRVEPAFAGGTARFQIVFDNATRFDRVAARCALRRRARRRSTSRRTARDASSSRCPPSGAAGCRSRA